MAKMTDEDFSNLTAYIKKKFGIHLPKEKKTLVESRLHKVLADLNLENMAAYYQYLCKDKSGKADASLVNAITTNHTFFMRESDHFQYYEKVVLPYFARSVRDCDLRTWCAACSSGEEAYTLAMLNRDYFSMQPKRWDTKLLATDISLKALKAAQEGIYTREATASLPERWKKIYFHRVDEKWDQVNDSLKAEVIFRQFNLMNQRFPFKRRFHTIFCRNVMIYFDRATRNNLIFKFHEWLEAGGFLFIGHSEVIDQNKGLFTYVMPSVYRKELSYENGKNKSLNR